VKKKKRKNGTYPWWSAVHIVLFTILRILTYEKKKKKKKLQTQRCQINFQYFVRVSDAERLICLRKMGPLIP